VRADTANDGAKNGSQALNLSECATGAIF
jgi:hypothetical protein